jgi:hypothetical protein
LAASSLVIGSLVAIWLNISLRVIGLIMGFGAGVLISAVAFDLVEEAAGQSSGVPDHPVPGPDRDRRGTMGDTVETGCERIRDHTLRKPHPADEHNPTRPDQPSSNRPR